MGKSPAVFEKNDATVAPTPTYFQGLEGARQYVRASRAINTQRGYKTDWQAFTCWCDTNRLQALPATPETVTSYISARAQKGSSISTIRRIIASINYLHRVGGVSPLPTEHPVFHTTWEGIR